MAEEPADPLTLAVHLDRLMRRIHTDLHPKATHLDDANVGPLGGMVLMTIEENAPMSVQDLSRSLARDKGQVTRFVQSLERKALVTRSECPDDRRVSMLALTEEGERLVTAFRGALAEVVDGLLVGLAPQERALFLSLIRKILRGEGEARGAQSTQG